MAVLALAALGRSAWAAPVTFHFEGTVNLVTDRAGFLDGSVAPGTPFTGSYTFDSSAPNVSPAGEDVGTYVFTGVPFGIAVQVGSYGFETSQLRIEVRGVAGSDRYVMFAFGDQVSGPIFPPILDVGPFVSWQLREAVGDPFSSIELPLEPPSLTDFAFNSFAIQLDNSRSGSPLPLVGISGPVTNIVPEPRSIALILSAIVGLSGYRSVVRRHAVGSSRPE